MSNWIPSEEEIQSILKEAAAGKIDDALLGEQYTKYNSSGF